MQRDFGGDAGIGQRARSDDGVVEFNIVRGLWRVGTWKGEAETLAFDTSKLPAEATAVALLLQAPDQGEILGAAKLALR